MATDSQKIAVWIEKIKWKMETAASTKIEFLPGVDYQPEDEAWIATTVLPALPKAEMKGKLVLCKDCGPPGRKFVFQLKKYKA